MEIKLENITETFVKELCKEPNIKEAFVREGIVEKTKQETLEEASERFSKQGFWQCPVSFEKGAKWQQEQNKNLYSEEEVDFLINLLKSTTEYEVLQSFRDKVEQFTK